MFEPDRLRQRGQRWNARARVDSLGRKMRAQETPEAQWRAFLARYDPKIAEQARDARRRLRAALPGAFELVYDNYNALVLAFGSSEKRTDIVCSIALYPRWVTLFFMHGSSLSDPHGLLEGSGTTIRGVRLTDGRSVDDPPIRALIAEAMRGRKLGGGHLVIKSISPKQRPRRADR
jgi:hypothetical protein